MKTLQCKHYLTFPNYNDVTIQLVNRNEKQNTIANSIPISNCCTHHKNTSQYKIAHPTVNSSLTFLHVCASISHIGLRVCAYKQGVLIFGGSLMTLLRIDFSILKRVTLLFCVIDSSFFFLFKCSSACIRAELACTHRGCRMWRKLMWRHRFFLWTLLCGAKRQWSASYWNKILLMSHYVGFIKSQL